MKNYFTIPGHPLVLYVIAAQTACGKNATLVISAFSELRTESRRYIRLMLWLMTVVIAAGFQAKSEPIRYAKPNETGNSRSRNGTSGSLQVQGNAFRNSGKIELASEEQRPILFVFGLAGYGRLGIGETDDQRVPVAIDHDNDWKEISAGGEHSLAVKTDGTLWAWGTGTPGRLGTGDAVNQYYPVRVGDATNWKKVSAGGEHSLAIKTDGTLWAWGGGYAGRLGTGNTDDQYSPVQIGEATDWIQVSAGYFHSAALKADGTLWAWGSGGGGSLGTGNTDNQHSPVQIGEASDWKQVSATDGRCLAIKSDGTLWAWGKGNDGALGTGNESNQYRPVQIGETADWAEVSAGRWQSIALKSDGTLWAWGRGEHLGIGDVENQYYPVRVGDAANWKHIKVGQDHTLAIKTDGTLWSWGHGSDGALGTGSTAIEYEPVQIGDGKYSDAAAGYFHSLALRQYEQELSFSTDGNRILYVKKGSTGNGSSWENAAGELGDALKWAHENKTLWAQGEALKIYVAKGTYKPMYKAAEADLANTPTTDRDKAFVMVKNVQLYGGFDPDNGLTTLEQRSQVNDNITILSGDLNNDDAADIDLEILITHSSRLDNAYHVVLSLNDVGSACLDGFTIAGGNGDKDGLAVPIDGLEVYRGFGGGISLWYSSLTIRNVTISGNSVRQSGAGLYTFASEPLITKVTMRLNAANQNGGGMAGNYYRPTLRNVVFEHNRAKQHGGALFDNQLNAKLTNVVFQHNSAGSYGGAVYSYYASSEYMNVGIHQNAAGDRGGAFFNSQSSPRLTNVTLTMNSGVYYNAGIYNHNSSPKFVNCIIWGNALTNGNLSNIANTSINSIPEYAYSIVQGSGGSAAWQGTPGLDKGNNLDIDPLFTNAPNGDFSLADGSSAIGVGNIGQYVAAGGNIATDTDLAGNPRVSGANIDIGAYEKQELTRIRYVRQGATGNGHSWAAASGDLQAMINQSFPDNEVWVATGEYQPASGDYFSMKEGVKIYGGFSETGSPDFADRNWTLYTTTLKGNGNSVIVNDNNGLTNAALLDGFTITGGSATTGGGMLNHLSYPLINHCVFKGNHATVWGGAIYNDGPGMTTIVNSLIYENTAQSGAGAFSYQNARPRFTNVTLSGNTAEQNGGALHNYEGAETELVNTIVWGNSQGAGSSQIYTAGEGKTKAYFSVLEGGAEAITGEKEIVDILSGNPLFTDPVNGDFTLQGCSPALNLGTGGVLQGFITDLAGNLRIVNSVVDAGAYEYQAAPLTGTDRLSLNGQSNSVDISAGQTYSIGSSDDACRSMVVVASNGASPVSGVVNVTTHIDATVQSHNGSPYVQRHYDISPVGDASSTTAQITLYFTQGEFDAYNTSLGANDLPGDATGNTTNVRVYQYHGTAANGNGPGSYQGAPVTIIPDVNWDPELARWELRFDVTGFSGFFVGSANAALPVKLVNFEGRRDENNIVALDWQVAEQVDMVEYIVERSGNALDFDLIGSIPANRTSESSYRFTDAHDHLESIVYYRLKMVETDGSFSYSRIISVSLPENNLIIYPVPSHSFVKVKGKGISGTSLTIVNAQGTVLKTVVAGSDNQELDISTLPAGMYFIRTTSGHRLKMVKN